MSCIFPRPVQFLVKVKGHGSTSWPVTEFRFFFNGEVQVCEATLSWWWCQVFPWEESESRSMSVCMRVCVPSEPCRMACLSVRATKCSQRHARDWVWGWTSTAVGKKKNQPFGNMYMCERAHGIHLAVSQSVVASSAMNEWTQAFCFGAFKLLCQHISETTKLCDFRCRRNLFRLKAESSVAGKLSKHIKHTTSYVIHRVMAWNRRRDGWWKQRFHEAFFPHGKRLQQQRFQFVADFYLRAAAAQYKARLLQPTLAAFYILFISVFSRRIPPSDARCLFSSLFSQPHTSAQLPVH